MSDLHCGKKALPPALSCFFPLVLHRHFPSNTSLTHVILSQCLLLRGPELTVYSLTQSGTVSPEDRPALVELAVLQIRLVGEPAVTTQ